MGEIPSYTRPKKVALINVASHDDNSISMLEEPMLTDLEDMVKSELWDSV